MAELDRCILTGIRFSISNGAEFLPNDGSFFSYQLPSVGKVKVALPTLKTLKANDEYIHPVVAGICRAAFEAGQEPPLIDDEFLSIGIKKANYPKSFKEKVRHLLKYIYNKGGYDFQPLTFVSARDYPLCYANDHEEFSRVMEYLEKGNLIQWKEALTVSGGVKHFLKVLLTDTGIEEVKKELPKVPMIGLVSQEISTGDTEIDSQINHAKDLFLQEPQTMERMRSACETLSYVLEPLRKELKNYFTVKDVSDFFNIVNNFDIRHNNEGTKNLHHPEQLEWIFYSLLNTINTYTKIKARLGS